jgi:phenylacetate-coenzyme A ligase PaaK-like adenylate-forming protein
MVEGAIGRAMGNERLSAEQFAALQQEKLRRLLRVAVEKSPLYAELYATIDVDTVPLAELPTTGKPLVQERFDDAVTDRRLTFDGVRRFCEDEEAAGSPFYLDEFAVMLSSGTTGQRGFFVMDGPALADACAVGFRQSNRQPPRAGPPPKQRIAAVMLIERFDAAGLLMRMIPDSVGEKRLIDIRRGRDEIVRELNEFQPTLLSSFPYMLRMLADAAAAGRLSISPGRITSSGDVLTASDRAAVRQAFGVQPLDYYCSTEAPYLAWESDAHDGLYVNADYYLVESVDHENRPVGAGCLGDKLLMTNLTNHIMPLIRYEMSDQVAFTSDAGSLGGPLPRIRTVAGRFEHTLVLPGREGGEVSLIPEHIDEFVGGLDGVANYQVIQDRPTQLLVNYIVQAPADGAAVGKNILAGLRACFQRYDVAHDVQVQLKPVETLVPIRPGSNKVCHYWNRCR